MRELIIYEETDMWPEDGEDPDVSTDVAYTTSWSEGYDSGDAVAEAVRIIAHGYGCTQFTSDSGYTPYGWYQEPDRTWDGRRCSAHLNGDWTEEEKRLIWSAVTGKSV